MKKKLFTLALSLAVLTALPMTATAEGLGRLKIALELHGATDWQGSGGAWQKTKVDDTYSTDVLLKAGILQNTNTVDPNSWKEQQAHLAQVQAHTAKVQERAAAAQGQSGGMGPGAMDMSKMKELRQKILACGTDEACKRQIATDMMSQDASRGPHAPTQ